MLRKCMQLGMQAACSQLETACARSGDGPPLSTGVPGVYKAPSGHPARPLLFSSCIEQVSATVGAAAEVERHGHCCGLHDAGCRALTALPAAHSCCSLGNRVGLRPNAKQLRKHSTMLISKKNRREVYKYLFKGGWRPVEGLQGRGGAPRRPMCQTWCTGADGGSVGGGSDSRHNPCRMAQTALK